MLGLQYKCAGWISQEAYPERSSLQAAPFGAGTILQAWPARLRLPHSSCHAFYHLSTMYAHPVQIGMMCTQRSFPSQWHPEVLRMHGYT